MRWHLHRRSCARIESLHQPGEGSGALQRAWQCLSSAPAAAVGAVDQREADDADRHVGHEEVVEPAVAQEEEVAVLQSNRLLIESRWVTKLLSFAGKL
jgi:hypothetical protein